MIIKEIDDNLLTIKYKIENSKEIKIFGKLFVKNNKNNCSIIIEDKEYNLCENLNQFFLSLQLTNKKLFFHRHIPYKLPSLIFILLIYSPE